MEIKIQAIHFDATEKLEAFIQKKAEKLQKALPLRAFPQDIYAPAPVRQVQKGRFH